MTEIEQTALYVEINQGNIQCGTAKCNETATDFIVQPIGIKDVVYVELIVPVCQSCIDYLDSTEWVLLYCTKCHASQWIYKKISKLQYGDQNIIWMDKCPKC